MPDNAKPLLFQLPNSAAVEGYAVRLADGRIVTRTREELARAPKGPAPSTAAPTP